MYTEQDFIDAYRGRTLRIWLGLALITFFLTLTVLFTVWEWEIPQMAAAGLGFAVNYFVWSLKIAPWIHYAKLMKEMEGGRHRTLECRFTGISETTRLYEGVEVRDMTVKVGDKEGDERLFMVDADKELPDFDEKALIRVTSYGNYVMDICEV